MAWAATLWLRQLGVLCGAAGQPGEDGDRAVAHVFERQPDLQLFDVLGEVAAGHALVDVLVPGERAELLDPRLDVVAGDAFAGGDGGEVDCSDATVDDALVVRDHAVGHGDAEVALGGEHGDPQPPLQHHLGLRRPERHQLRARVAGGEDVGDHVRSAYGPHGAPGPHPA